MSVRILFAILYVAGFSIAAWRGYWYAGLCAAILLMGVVEHPDMPNSIGGVQGFNLWNILILNVVLAWLKYRRDESLVLDPPRPIVFMLSTYALIMLISFVRLWFDRSNLDPDDFTSSYLISEYIINSYKWIIPAILLFDGCRTRRRLVMALCSILGIYVALAVQVIRWMPLENITASGDDLNKRAAKILANEVGYNRVNLSMLLGGACWAMLAMLQIVKRGWIKAGVIGMAGIIALGQALTGGRTGYATWGVVGVCMGFLRWRKLLPLIPITAVIIITFIPAVRERMLMGITNNKRSGADSEQLDDYTMTSGRTMIWPYVIDRIAQKPVLGWGRLAMQRTGLARFLFEELGEEFPHPHNAYFEMLFDNGVVGLAMVLPFYLTVLVWSMRLLRDKNNDYNAIAGGVGTSLILSLLVASVGSQTFYPREGAVGMWAAIGIIVRLWVDKKNSADTLEIVEAGGTKVSANGAAALFDESGRDELWA